MNLNYQLAKLLNIPDKDIERWSLNADLATGLIRQHCTGCYLHLKIGVYTTAWIEPHPGYSIPRQGDTVSEAICNALIDWLEYRTKKPEWTPQDK